MKWWAFWCVAATAYVSLIVVAVSVLTAGETVELCLEASNCIRLPAEHSEFLMDWCEE